VVFDENHLDSELGWSGPFFSKLYDNLKEARLFADKRSSRTEKYTVKAGVEIEGRLYATDDQPYSSKAVA